MGDRPASRASPTPATPEGSETDDVETIWKLRVKYTTKRTEGTSRADVEKAPAAVPSREEVDDTGKASTRVPVAARQRRKHDAEKATTVVSAPAMGQEAADDVARASTAVAAAAAAGAVAARIAGHRVASQDEVQAVQQRRGCGSDPSIVCLMAAAGLLVVFYLLLRPGSKGSH